MKPNLKYCDVEMLLERSVEGDGVLSEIIQEILDHLNLEISAQVQDDRYGEPDFNEEDETIQSFHLQQKKKGQNEKSCNESNH